MRHPAVIVVTIIAGLGMGIAGCVTEEETLPICDGIQQVNAAFCDWAFDCQNSYTDEYADKAECLADDGRAYCLADSCLAHSSIDAVAVDDCRQVFELLDCEDVDDYGWAPLMTAISRECPGSW